MGKLLVQKLHPDAKLPTIAYPGQDLGYDIYALEDTFLEPGKQAVVKTGIAALYVAVHERVCTGGWGEAEKPVYGLEVEDRSGMAAKNGIHIMAGKIDAGYRGEIGVVMILIGPPQQRSPRMEESLSRQLCFEGMEELERTQAMRSQTQEQVESYRRAYGGYPAGEGFGYMIKAGDKIAQLLPREVLASKVEEVGSLPESGRGSNGFGSSGR